MRIATKFLLAVCVWGVAHEGSCATEKPRVLSAKEAAAMAVTSQLTVRLAHARNDAAAGKVMQDAAALLPHVVLNARQTRVWRENRAAMGFPSGGVVDYDSFDARVALVQKIFDVSAFEAMRAGQRDRAVVKLEEALAVKQVEEATYLQYIDLLRLESEQAAAEADTKLAQDLLTLARHQETAGLASGLDVVRLESRAAADETRRIGAQIALANASVMLNRLVGLPLDTTLRLTDSLAQFKEEAASTESMQKLAEENRTELQIARERVSQADCLTASAKAERLPTVELFADAGKAGETSSRADKKVGKGGIAVSMPLFEGGLIAGGIARARSVLTQAKLAADDQRIQIEQDVRLSAQTYLLAAQQVTAAQKALEFAEKEMTMSRDRFSSGIGNNIDLVDAQAGLARARSDYNAALAQYHTARLDRAAATGTMAAFDLLHEHGADNDHT